MNKFLGNKKLLEKRKIGFIACDISVTNGTTALIAKTTLGWAEKISSEADAVMVSGFHSTLEKSVLKYLLQGKCGIIVMLARGMYRRLPKMYQAAMDENRLLIIALEKDSVTRVTKRAACRRDKYVKKIANECREVFLM